MATTLDRIIQQKQTTTAPVDNLSFKSNGTTLDKYLTSSKINIGDTRAKMKQRDDEYNRVLKEKKREESLRLATEETQNYIKEYKDASEGFWGSMATRFGIGVTAPKLATETPEYQAYRSETERINKENLDRSIAGNIGQTVKKMFTENTTETIFDTVYQKDLDKQSMGIIEDNTKKIVELTNRNKDEKDDIAKNKRENAIRFLLDQNKQVAEKVGGELKNKTNQQLIGQSIGTALELLPPTIGAGMTQAGKIVLAAGTKQAMKALGKEAVIYGATTSAAETMKEKDATTGDIVKSGTLGAGLGALTIAFPGLIKYISKKGAGAISDIIGKLSGKNASELTSEETKIINEITSKKVDVNEGRNIEIEPSVVQIIDTKTGEKTFSSISKGELKDFHRAIDDTSSGIAGKEIDGKIYHLTAKSPEQMESRGFKNLGTAKIEDIPSPVAKEIVSSRKESPKVDKSKEIVSESPILKKVNTMVDEASKVDENLPTTSFKKQFSLADKQINENPQEAYNRAVFGKEEDDITKSALQLSFLERAKQKGDNKAIAEIGMAAAKHGRKQGQEIVMFRSLYEQDPTNRLLVHLARTKLANVEARYSKTFQKLFGKGEGDIVSSSVKRVKNASSVKLRDAQDIINSFICT